MNFLKLLIVLTLFFFHITYAQEIGIAWEFNEDGNTEGWNVSSVKDYSVSNGTLKATAKSIEARFTGPEMNLPAEDFGFIEIRMKAIGPKSSVIGWTGDSTSFAYERFPFIGDSSFHVYNLPVYQNEGWKGNITQIERLTMRAETGSEIEIDYIRIVSIGARQEIAAFKPLRTILKIGENIPLVGVVKNTGDKSGTMHWSLQLPDEFELIEGDLGNEPGVLESEESDTLHWVIRCNSLGSYQLQLHLFSENDTTDSTFEAPIVDTFWQLDKFFLSGWSPPSQIKEPFDYYSNANFEMVLWLYPDEVSTAQAEQHKMQYILSAGHLLREHHYLRAADNKQPEELPAEDLAKLDGMINQFKDREAVLGYHLTDEPNAHAFENLSKVVSYLREKDPTRLSYINLFPTYASKLQLGTPTYDEHIEQFIDVVKPELLSYDHYHFFKGYDGGGYFLNLGLIRKWASRYDIPFCNIIQSIGTDGTPHSHWNWRCPNANEHRWLVYSTLAYGAKAIVWYPWTWLKASPKHDELYASIKLLNKEINRLGPVLITLKSTAVYHTQPQTGGRTLPENNLVKSISTNADLVVGLFQDKDDIDHIMFMNKDYNNSVTTTITLDRCFDDIKSFNVDSDQWELVDHENTAVGAVFELVLSPGNGILFKFGEMTGVEGFVPQKAPARYGLEQNYPNPFNPQTVISYQLPIDSHVKLTIYSITGQKVSTLVSEKQKAGNYKIEWNAAALASGMYLYRISAGDFVRTKKLILLK